MLQTEDRVFHLKIELDVVWLLRSTGGNGPARFFVQYTLKENSWRLS